MQNTAAFTKTILIVDDDPGWAQVAAHIFQTADFFTHIAANSTAAISYLQATMPDCVLLDYYLPDHNGGSVADYIHNNEKLKTTPLIMVSGDESLAKSAHYACKADSFVVKNNDMFGMLYTVEGLLRRVNVERGIMVCNDIRLDRASLCVQRKTGQVVTLSSEQFTLLYFLVGKSPSFISEKDIAKHIFKAGEDDDKGDAIRGLAHRLRKQLGPQLGARIEHHNDVGWAYIAPRTDKRSRHCSGKPTR